MAGARTAERQAVPGTIASAHRDLRRAADAATAPADSGSTRCAIEMAGASAHLAMTSRRTGPHGAIVAAPAKRLVGLGRDGKRLEGVAYPTGEVPGGIDRRGRAGVRRVAGAGRPAGPPARVRTAGGASAAAQRARAVTGPMRVCDPAVTVLAAPAESAASAKV
ncbi:hypothetical protein LNKW23_35360 [Paralimibaculum aggregatum]|uniref:Uncharacterized protein n=2 Tax=Paralimibaculum aggregatum TaxID=3036245 RepID=A0ABQ6LRY7_9RHOB|nr:hypothetical protein LNKW23_35360 [Limibaculum sp. NKW23]